MEVQLAAGPSVTTRTVAEFAGRLGHAAAADGIVIDVSLLDDVDLTFVQLIDAYRADFVRSGRRLTLSDRGNPHIASLLSRCGYLEAADRSDIEFWTGEGSE